MSKGGTTPYVDQKVTDQRDYRLSGCQGSYSDGCHEIVVRGIENQIQP